MATNSAPGDGASSGSTAEPGLWPLIIRHKQVAAAVLVVFVLGIAVTVIPGLVGSNSGPLSDSTTCAEWAAASSSQKSAYVQLYLDEYGSFSGAGRTAAAVQSAISRGCVHATYLGEADDLTVVAAVRGDL
jgi:hypothetical protein